MNIPRHLIFALTFSTASLGYAQTTILSQDFSDITPASYTVNNSTMGSGNGLLTALVSTNDKLEVTSGGTLRFTDGTAGGSLPNAIHSFSGTTTNGSGNNAIVGSFDFQSLAVSSGSRGSFVFMINAANQANSSSNTSVYLLFDNNGLVSYTNAGVLTSSGFSISNGINYRLSLVADYSNTTGNDTYSFIITNLDTSSVAYTSSVISTRAAANLTPNVIAFYGGAHSTNNSPDPFFQIDNLNFETMNIAAIPEPSTMAALLGFTVLARAGMQRRRRHV
jgi:hypothetical protein